MVLGATITREKARKAGPRQEKGLLSKYSPSVEEGRNDESTGREAAWVSLVIGADEVDKREEGVRKKEGAREGEEEERALLWFVTFRGPRGI